MSLIQDMKVNKLHIPQESLSKWNIKGTKLKEISQSMQLNLMF